VRRHCQSQNRYFSVAPLLMLHCSIIQAPQVFLQLLQQVCRVRSLECPRFQQFSSHSLLNASPALSQSVSAHRIMQIPPLLI
jgi:hypothetical protein